jgi:hypothetical protein
MAVGHRTTFCRPQSESAKKKKKRKKKKKKKKKKKEKKKKRADEWSPHSSNAK